MKDIKKLIKERKNDPIVNEHLNKHLQKIIDKELLDTLTIDAMKLLKLANRKEIGEFLFYYHSKQCNIICMILDSIFARLKKENKLPENIGTDFDNEFYLHIINKL